MNEYNPQITDTVTGYNFEWPDLNLKATVSHIHSSWRGLSAEIDLYHEDLGMLRGAVELTLGSQSGSRDLVSSIKRRVKDSLDYDWDRIVEAICVSTKRRYRTANVEKLNLLHYMVDRQDRYCLYPYVMHGSINVLYGQPGSLKSYFALSLGISIQTGHDIVGFSPTCKHQMCYIDWEDGPDEHGVRARRILTGKNLAVEVDDLAYIRAHQGLPILIDDLQPAIAGCDLVCIDSAVLAGGGDPNSDDTVRAVSNALRQLNATVILIGHDTKDGNRGMRGSKMWTAMCRNAFEVKVHSDPGQSELFAVMYHRKSNRGAKHKSVGYQIVFDDDADSTFFNRSDEALTVSPTLSAELSVKERIDSVLTEAMSTKDLIDAIGSDVSAKTVSNTLTRYAKKGVYTKVGYRPLWGKGLSYSNGR